MDIARRRWYGTSSRDTRAIRWALAICITTVFGLSLYYGVRDSANWLHNAPLDSTDDSPLAKTARGDYLGLRNSTSGLDEFLGIAYAQPPVADLRFRRPAPLNASWMGLRTATSRASWCVGYGPAALHRPGSEDCLYLNIFRVSSSPPPRTLPVVVYIHGGAFEGGSGNDDKYDPSYILKQATALGRPFLFVTLDYRLSIWGFINSAEAKQQDILNLGLHDQRLALQWIEQNIDAFGGDPAKVTLWGHSAGAVSVGFHLLSRARHEAKRLYRAAIMQSGSPTHYERFRDTASLQPWYNEIVTAVGCRPGPESLACLRRTDFQTLQHAIGSHTGEWSVTLDDDAIAGQPSRLLAAGDFAHVPILCGSNTGDGESFMHTNINNDGDFQRFLTDPSLSIPTLGLAQPETAHIEPLYPCTSPSCPSPSPHGSESSRAATFLTDYMFNAPRLATLRAWTTAGVAAYSYSFGIPRRPDLDAALHTDERLYTFNRTDLLPAADNKRYAEAQARMANGIISFVADMDPGSWVGGSGWPRWEVSEPQHILFEAVGTTVVRDDVRHEAVDEVIKLLAEVGR